MGALKPIADEYARDQITVKPGSRLHRLIARLFDSYIDDITDERLLELELLADSFRITHASGQSFDSSAAA